MDNANILALSCRPTCFEDLIGQESATTTLTNAFTEGKLYPGLLFSGSFGCGKTSAARILAAMENCEKGPTLKPCGKCTMCKEIFAGESNDVKEINAASSNGIDDIRYIADFVSVRPLLARTKYIILDECHALTKQAVESALKLLEEPPEGVRFVLCTTDLHKMKGTIQSRCMPFRFVKVYWQKLADHLTKIAQQYKFDVEEGAIKLAAKMADGSVRNSLRNLQLLVNFAGSKKVTTELAQLALGSLDDTYWFTLIESILKMDATTSIKTIQNIFNNGQEAAQIIEGLSEHLRTLLILTSCKNTSGLIFLSNDEKQRYIQILAGMSIDLVVEMISLLHKVMRGLTYNLSPQMLLETYVLESIQAHAAIGRAKAKGNG